MVLSIVSESFTVQEFHYSRTASNATNNIPFIDLLYTCSDKPELRTEGPSMVDESVGYIDLCAKINIPSTVSISAIYHISDITAFAGYGKPQRK